MGIRTAAVVCLALTASACAGNSSPEGPEVGTQERYTEIRVQNTTPNTLRVFALAGNAETPIGRVDAMSQEVLRLPGYVAPVIRLVARPAVNLRSERAHVSEPVSIFPGQRITWELRASPGISDVPRMSIIKIAACADLTDC
jgi:hypothetical protein